MNEAQSTALEKAPTPGELAKAESTQLTVSTAMLDRENLVFFANMIQMADLVPKGNEPLEVRKSRVMAKICAGVAHGFDPISSQQNLDIIDGKIGLNARGTEVKISRTGRYTTRIEELTAKGCKLAVLHREHEAQAWKVIGFVEFNEEMAKKAGLTTKTNSMYGKYAEDMYYARCITRVAKRFVPEALDTIGVQYDLAKKPEPPQPEPQPDPPASQLGAGDVETGAAAPGQAPPPAQEPPADEPPAEVGAEYVDQEYTEPEAMLTETEPAVEEEEPPTAIDPLERLRTNVQVAFEALPAEQQKNLIAGKPIVANMSEDELRDLLQAIAEQQ